MAVLDREGALEDDDRSANAASAAVDEAVLAELW
jgi:hypothetical protein